MKKPDSTVSFLQALFLAGPEAALPHLIRAAFQVLAKAGLPATWSELEGVIESSDPPKVSARWAKIQHDYRGTAVEKAVDVLLYARALESCLSRSSALDGLKSLTDAVELHGGDPAVSAAAAILARDPRTQRHLAERYDVSAAAFSAFRLLAAVMRAVEIDEAPYLRAGRKLAAGRQKGSAAMKALASPLQERALAVWRGERAKDAKASVAEIDRRVAKKVKVDPRTVARWREKRGKK